MGVHDQHLGFFGVLNGKPGELLDLPEDFLPGNRSAVFNIPVFQGNINIGGRRGKGFVDQRRLILLRDLRVLRRKGFRRLLRQTAFLRSRRLRLRYRLRFLRLPDRQGGNGRLRAFLRSAPALEEGQSALRQREPRRQQPGPDCVSGNLRHGPQQEPGRRRNGNGQKQRRQDFFQQQPAPKTGAHDSPLLSFAHDTGYAPPPPDMPPGKFWRDCEPLGDSLDKGRFFE